MKLHTIKIIINNNTEIQIISITRSSLSFFFISASVNIKSPIIYWITFLIQQKNDACTPLLCLLPSILPWKTKTSYIIFYGIPDRFQNLIFLPFFLLPTMINLSLVIFQHHNQEYLQMLFYRFLPFLYNPIIILSLLCSWFILGCYTIQ